MKKQLHKAWSLFLALVLTLSLALPAHAADLRLDWRRSGSGFALTLRGLGEESIYGAQLELTVEGSYQSATFTPTNSGAYSECRVSTGTRNTRVVIYLTAQKPLNEGSELAVGTLTLDEEFTMPTEVTVTLLGHELKTLATADGVVIPAVRQAQDDGDDSPETYRVRVSSARHGVVTADMTRATAREVVTLTVTPEEGYGLNQLNVTASGGREMDITDMGGGKYTFRMPAGSVEVTAVFLEAGQNHPIMSFEDVAEWDWFHSAVHYVYENGMMSGTSETEFSPNIVTTRGMVVTVLHRLEGTPEAAESDFSDVDREMYYAKAVDWAYANGIVSGYDGNEAGTFGPGNSITREQLATILYRYAEKKGHDMTVRGDLTIFEDWETISEYAREPLSWAVGAGLISGMEKDEALIVSPTGFATRAQVATILMRYCQSMD
ncbi:MAG: S-layer homology domain-containing protein [Oscillospiraceae bacterium]|nr:S-layer homology domain-containing protein [Oscillospiraceae bacterium]